MIEIRCLHDLARAECFRGAMDALNLASSRPDPFSTLAYYRHYLRAGEPARHAVPPRPWLLLALRGDELLGYLALKQCTHRVLGLRADKLDLLAAHTADRPHLVARPEHSDAVAAAMYAHLLGRRREWSLLEFQQQDAGSPLLPPPAGAVARGCRARFWPDSDSATIPIRWDSLAGYFAALPKKSRSNVSRQMRSLLAAGDVQLLTASEPATRTALFELFRGVEAHSWKAGTVAGLGGAGRWEDYYAGLMDPAAPMRLTVQVLLLDGVPVAGLISGAFDGGLYALHIVHDERLASLAPGSAVLLMGMRLAIGGGYVFFNLLRGSGYYKTRWLAQLIPTRSVQIYRFGSPFHWRRMLGDLARRLSAPWTPTGTVLSNPAHRALRGAEAVGDLQAAVNPDERRRYAHAVQATLRGQGEFLSAAQLAAVLPFDSQRRGTARDG